MGIDEAVELDEQELSHGSLVNLIRVACEYHKDDMIAETTLTAILIKAADRRPTEVRS